MINAARQTMMRPVSVATYTVVSFVSSTCWAELPQGKFIDPKPVAGIERSSEFYPVVSADELELYFRSDDEGNPDIWVARRSDRDRPFEDASILAEVQHPSDDNPGSLSADGLTLYFGSSRSGNFDMYQAVRKDLSSPFDSITDLGPNVTGNELENFPAVSPDGTSLYYHISSSPGDSIHSLWTATRTRTRTASSPIPRTSGTSSTAIQPSIPGNRRCPRMDSRFFFSDGFFREPRPDGQGQIDISVWRRESTTDPFGVPQNLNDVWPGTRNKHHEGTGRDGLYLARLAVRRFQTVLQHAG